MFQCRKYALGLTCILLTCLPVCAHAQSENIISLKQLRSDNACGPRCIYALMQVTRAGKPDCNVKCIYELLGKQPFSATSLSDLKFIAERLGFSATGYRMTAAELKNTSDYVILRLRGTTPHRDRPHFVLVERTVEDYAIIVNTTTLGRTAIMLAELGKYWDGRALVISAGKREWPSEKPVTGIEHLSKESKSWKHNGIKDYGHVETGSRLEHTFVINNGPEPVLNVQVMAKSCSCLMANLGKNLNGQHTITLELVVDKPGWQEAYALVSLYPQASIKRYTVKAYGKDSFQLSPKIVHIEAPKAGQIEYRVRLDYFTDVNDAVKFVRMESNAEGLSVGRVTSTASSQEQTCTFSFEIPLIYDTGPKPHKVKHVAGSLTFVLDTVKGPRCIPLIVSAKIGTDKFKLTPEKLFIIASRSANATTKKVKVELLEEPFPDNLTAALTAPLPVDIEVSRVSGSTYMIEVTTLPQVLRDTSLGLHKSEIVITIDGESDMPQMTVPISMFVRE